MSNLTVDGQAAGNGIEEENENDDLEVDNSKSVLHKIANLYAEQLMSDLILDVGGVDYPAHRLILCANSGVFQVMLMNREWSEWSESRIALQETPAAADVFPHFLKYFYTGQIRISHGTVLPVLTLADKYDVGDLVDLCLEYMREHTAGAARRGLLVPWVQYTVAAGHDEVATVCQNFVKWNLEWVWAEADLSELDGDTLVQLLQQNDLVLHNEMTLYHIVTRWLTAQKAAGAAWDDLVPAVFAHIRFPMMCPNQLANLLLCPLTQEHKDFFMERMAVAMSYQSGQRSGRLVAGPQFTPRLYTDDTWGSMLTVDNFHSLPSYHTRTFIFSTKSSIADVPPQDKLTEWTVDLYPKGVWFRKSLLIVWAGTYDVPDVVLRTVRLSLTCHSADDPARTDDVRVKIGVLVWGVQKGVEHVTTVVERIHRFSPQNRVLNIDGAVDFDELNTPLYSPGASHRDSPAHASTPPTHPRPRRCSRCSEEEEEAEPRHLIGPNRDQLRIQVVILPLTEYCDVGA